MEFREFAGYIDVYPERIEGTSQWFYCQCTPCGEAYEVPEYNGNYMGTRLYIFNIDGDVFEPISQKKNVFIDAPVFSNERHSFGIILYDFNQSVIQAFEYFPKQEKLSLLVEIPISKAGDLVNVRIVKEPFILVKHDVHNNGVDFLWPVERHYQFEENESLCFIDGETLITSKWIEDPNYREEIIFRQVSTGNIVKRKAGLIVEMPNGEKWLMTE